MSIVLVIAGWIVLIGTSSWVKTYNRPSGREFAIVCGIALCGLGLFCGGILRFLMVNHIVEWIGEHVKF
jgi:hypothetical protein